MAINVGYFARESLQNFRRNWVMSLGAVITIYLSLLLVGASVVTGIVVNSIVKSVEQKVTIQVFLKDGAAPADVDALQTMVSSDPLTKNVTYVTKEQALQRFKQQMKDSPQVVDQLEYNPLPASLDVDLKDPRTVQQMVDKIKASPAFPKVADKPDNPTQSLRYGQSIVQRLFAVTRLIRLAEAVFIVMLAVVSLIFINNTIRLAIYARRKEIGIMRLVGASNWFIRTPFLMEGLLQALVGALLAIVTLVIVQIALLPRVRDVLKFLPFGLTPAASAQVAAILLLAGVAIGLAGSGLALRRYLRV